MAYYGLNKAKKSMASTDFNLFSTIFALYKAFTPRRKQLFV
jgi:hypothetical protein